MENLETIQLQTLDAKHAWRIGYRVVGVTANEDTVWDWHRKKRLISKFQPPNML